jgi:hypothetical protein
MAIYWHPFLAQYLRQSYGDRLIIQDEFGMGKMPRRVDFLILKRDPRDVVPFPLDHLGEHTLLSFCGPDDWAKWEDLVELETYGLMYQLRAKLETREELTLWLAASYLNRDVGKAGGAILRRVRKSGKGVRRGTLDNFPTCLINLNELPVNDATLPLLLVAKGKQEKKLGEFLVEHPQEQRYYLLEFARLHIDALEEVLKMRKMTAEEIGIDIKSYMEFIEKHYGKERVLELMGEDYIREWLEKKGKEQNDKSQRKRRAK